MFILISSSHQNPVCTFSPIRVTCPVHNTILHLITRSIYNIQHNVSKANCFLLRLGTKSVCFWNVMQCAVCSVQCAVTTETVQILAIFQMLNHSQTIIRNSHPNNIWGVLVLHKQEYHTRHSNRSNKSPTVTTVTAVIMWSTAIAVTTVPAVIIRSR
jgi:hypothetical protein